MHPIVFYRHAQNQKLLMNSFQENVQKPHFLHLLSLNPQIKIFPKYGPKLKWCALLPSIIMQKI